MISWVAAQDGLPAANEVVDVSLAFTHGGSTQLRGYRLVSRGGGESLWLNALTHEPFPQGWQVVKWKTAGKTAAPPGAPGTNEFSRPSA